MIGDDVTLFEAFGRIARLNKILETMTNFTFDYELVPYYWPDLFGWNITERITARYRGKMVKTLVFSECLYNDKAIMSEAGMTIGYIISKLCA